MLQTIIRVPCADPITIITDFAATSDNYRAAVGGDWELVRIRPEMLSALCTLVGIMPESLRTFLPDPEGSRDVVLIVHETGARDGLPLNPAASVLYGGPFWFLRQAMIYGNAIVVEVD